MFTGIIVDVGRLVSRERRGKGARVVIETALDLSRVNEGDSIAVNGICLTAIGLSAHRFEADASEETLLRTTLGQLPTGSAVNLEPALRVGDPLGGHWVQGHVDGVGTWKRLTPTGECYEAVFEIPEVLMDTVVEKGSITIDGISLTVAKVKDREVSIAVVPHTLGQTNLGSCQPGVQVNIETDIIGKYVRHTLLRSSGKEDISMDVLKKYGFA